MTASLPGFSVPLSNGAPPACCSEAKHKHSFDFAPHSALDHTDNASVSRNGDNIDRFQQQRDVGLQASHCIKISNVGNLSVSD